MGRIRLRGAWVAEVVAAIALLTTTPASGFIVQEGEEGRVIQTLIETEILPLFAAAPGIVSGIEDLTIDQDPEDTQSRIWIFSIILTEQTPQGIAIIQEELMFKGVIGTMPHLINKGTPRPWPDDPPLRPN